jgi:hypothetical protein
MEKQKLLFHQSRLANRGVAEMVLLHISACKGVPSEMVMKTLELGISVLRGGNLEIQLVRLGFYFMIRTKKLLIALYFVGNVEPPKRKERCWILHINSWPHELM